MRVATHTSDVSKYHRQLYKLSFSQRCCWRSNPPRILHLVDW